MLPVACLPAAGILMGIGYWIDPTGWGANSAIAAFLIKAGGAIIDNMAILFAIGVGVGMADDHEGTSALAALVSWLMIQTILSPGVVAMLKGIDVSEVNAAFGKIGNQFIGIVSGIIGATCYNKFKNTKLPDALAFFSGKRSVAIITALISLVACLVLFFTWPVVYSGLVGFGKSILGLGALGAGIYGFLKQLLVRHRYFRPDRPVHDRFLPGYDVWSSGSSPGYVSYRKAGKEENCIRLIAGCSSLFFLYRCNRTSGICFYVPCTRLILNPCYFNRYFFSCLFPASCTCRF